MSLSFHKDNRYFGTDTNLYLRLLGDIVRWFEADPFYFRKRELIFHGFIHFCQNDVLLTYSISV